MTQSTIFINKERFATNFAKSVKEEGQRLAKNMGMSFSALITQALVEFIEKYKKYL